MAHDVSCTVILGSAKTGLTLTAQLKDSAGSNVSSSWSIVEIGGGNYLATSTNVPDGHRGCVRFTGTGVDVIAPIGPEDTEGVIRSDLPSNFDLLEIDGGGVVGADVQKWLGDAADPLPDNFSDLAIEGETGLVTTTGGVDTGSIAEAVWDFEERTLTSDEVIVIHPIASGGFTTIFSGADYTAEDDTELSYQVSGPDLTGATVYMLGTRNRGYTTGTESFEWPMSVTTPTGSPQVVTLAVAADETQELAIGSDSYSYIIYAELDSGNVVALARSTITVVGV